MNQKYYTIPPAGIPTIPVPAVLDVDQVLADFGVANTLKNHRAVAVGKSLIPDIQRRTDGSFLCPDPILETGVIVSITEYPHGGPAVYCTCAEWYAHNKPGRLFADPDWLCCHGAAVRLCLGHSDAYYEWIEASPTHLIKPVEAEITNHCGKFYACLKSISRALARHGISGENVKQGYYALFSVKSMADLNEAQWAQVGAELSAAVGSVGILAGLAARTKRLIGREVS